MPGTVIITGPQQFGPNIPCRLEINDLIKDPIQFSLYIQAITAIQQLPQDEVQSWFALGGIHGQPIEDWDNAGPKPEKGYCVHGLRLFPTWHRGYVALYEQTLQKNAIRIANGYADSVKEEWITAAQNLRAPFWDWARHILPPDEVWKLDTLRIITKDGEKDVPNPLMGYTFNPQLKPPYDMPKTWRAEGMERRLRSVEKRLKVDVLKALLFLDDWNDFSNRTVMVTNKPVANSLETLHDGLHVRCGGSKDGKAGTMGSPPVGAFEPLFWLHHSNVDRQFALWQAIHPTVWVGEGEAGNQTDLLPFWNTGNTFHRSAYPPMREWRDLGYNYPEFTDLDEATQEETQRSILHKLIALYSPLEGVHNHTDWFVRSRSPTYILGGNYALFFFFDHPSHRDLPHDCKFRFVENLVGAGEVFAHPEPLECPTCSSHLRSFFESIVYLTQKLREHEVYEKSREDIKRHIRKHLNFRVQKIDGTVVPPEDIEGLEITVETTEVTYHPGPSSSRPVQEMRLYPTEA